MKALEFDKFGEPEKVLKLKDKEIPEPAKGEVLVKMLYSPVNPSDFNIIRGTYRDAIGRAIWNQGDAPLSMDPFGERLIPQPPYVPGGEGVGIVEKSGGGVFANRLVGKRVAVLPSRMGNWQEYTVVSALQALPIPGGVSDEAAASFFINPATAYAMVIDVLRPPKGTWLMQSAANSEVGKMVIRLCKARGIKTINLVRKTKYEGALKQLGADEVICLDRDNLVERVFSLVGRKGVSYALDPTGGKIAAEMLTCLGLDGRLLIYGTIAGQNLSFSARDIMAPQSRLQGFFLANWLAGRNRLKIISTVKKVGRLIDEGVLSSESGEVFALKDYKVALKASMKAGKSGKTLLRLTSE